MPKIEQYDWSKLKPNLPEVRTTHNVNPDDLNWLSKKKTSKAVNKIYGKARISKSRKTSLSDPLILENLYSQASHLRSIRNELL